MSQDFKQLRNDFPILKTTINGNPLVYLDSAASAQKPQIVLDALHRAYTEAYSNVHSGLHELSMKATSNIESARAAAARFVNAKDANEIFFNSGATMGLNQISWGMSHRVEEGDNIVITVAEHNANVVCWQRLCEVKGAELRFVAVKENGAFDFDAFNAAIDERTKIIAFPHVSNVLGTVFPILEISLLAKKVGALVVVDGCQGSVHTPVDVQLYGCDFYVWSSHKCYGPSGVGAVWGRMELLEEMDPLLVGGGMVKEVTQEETNWTNIPHRFEAGTPPIAETYAFGVAMDYMMRIGVFEIDKHERELLKHAREQMIDIEGLHIVGDAPTKSGVISFYVDGVNMRDVTEMLNTYGVAVRTGKHCAHILHEFMGVETSTRLSMAVHTTTDDIDYFVESLKKVLTILK